MYLWPWKNMVSSWVSTCQSSVGCVKETCTQKLNIIFSKTTLHIHNGPFYLYRGLDWVTVHGRTVQPPKVHQFIYKFRKKPSPLSGGFNPLEKYSSKMGSSSPFFGVKMKNIWVATTQFSYNVILTMAYETHLLFHWSFFRIPFFASVMSDLEGGDC